MIQTPLFSHDSAARLTILYERQCKRDPNRNPNQTWNLRARHGNGLDIPPHKAAR